MTPEEAKQIIDVLASGVDPATGELRPMTTSLIVRTSSVRCSLLLCHWNGWWPSLCTPALQHPARLASLGAKTKSNASWSALMPARRWPR